MSTTVVKLRSRTAKASSPNQIQLKEVKETVEDAYETKEDMEEPSLNTKETEKVHEYDRVLSRGKLMLEGIQPIVKDVLYQLVDRMREEQIKLSPQTIIPIVKIAMEIVEKTALKGIQKRELVNEMMLHVIEASPLNDEQRELCKMLIDNDIIGNTVDVIVNATKGTLNINHIEKIAESTSTCCFAFLSRNQK